MTSSTTTSTTAAGLLRVHSTALAQRAGRQLSRWARRLRTKAAIAYQDWRLGHIRQDIAHFEADQAALPRLISNHRHAEEARMVLRATLQRTLDDLQP